MLAPPNDYNALKKTFDSMLINKSRFVNTQKVQVSDSHIIFKFLVTILFQFKNFYV